jgi:hypothetical protein
MIIQDILTEDPGIAGIDLIDVPGFLEFLLRFGFNMVAILILVRYLYYPATKRKDYLFTYILISTVVFLLCFLLESVKLQIGFALGLFAIFGIIRYRTDTMPIKEMTYLFLVIGISVINALTTSSTSIVDLLFANVSLIAITYGLERLWLLKHEASKTIIYEKIDLIRPEKYAELLKDLTERTGIRKINRVETGTIDFLKDTCVLKIYYDSNSAGSLSEDVHVNDCNDDE